MSSKKIEYKKPMRKIALLLVMSVSLALSTKAAPSPYGMIGLTAGETLRINVANPALPLTPGAVSPGPCRVELEFLDGSGNVLLPAVQFTLKAGESAHYDLNGDKLIPPVTTPSPSRMEVRPVVLILPSPTAVGIAALALGPCVSSIEIFDNATGKTLVTSGPQNPGDIAGFNPQPDPPKLFGQLGIVAGQTIRLNAVNVLDPGTTVVPPGPCRVTLVLFGADGGILVHSSEVLQPGAATFLDFSLPVIANSIRTEVRADVTVESLNARLAPPDPCRATLELFDNASGQTTAIQSPQDIQNTSIRAALETSAD
jgi:hypothetical protein